MQTYDRHRLERHARRIEELRLWRNAYEILVKGWRFVAGEGEPKEIDPGDFWPEVGISVRLSARATVPQKWAGLPVELELWLGGEGFVEISAGDHRTASGLNPFHRSFPTLDEARGGEEVGIERAERVNLLEKPEGTVEVGAMRSCSTCGRSRC